MLLLQPLKRSGYVQNLRLFLKKVYRNMSDLSNERLFRFVGFENFVDTIQRKALAFVNHDLWEDPYEGALFKIIRTEEGRNKVLQILQNLFPNPQMPHTVTLELIHRMSPCIHGQSWTKCEESDAIWRIYSNNCMSIRMEVSYTNLNRLEGINIHDIIYDDTYFLQKEVESIVENENHLNIGGLLLRKRTAFSHEQEVRLLSHLDLTYLHNHRNENEKLLMKRGLEALRKSGEITRKQENTGLANIYKEKQSPVKYISFDNIENFITSVLVHPQAQKWFVETVEKFCEINELRFLGKSKLYTFTL